MTNWNSSNTKLFRSTRKQGKAVVAFLTALLLGAANAVEATSLTEVTGFGSNLGNLRMFQYIPDDLQPSAPLVVALHGCTQTASAYDNESGWTELADKWGFALLLPQQKAAFEISIVQGIPTLEIGNNLFRCFNWFLPEDSQRNQGEALSIKQMIDKMKADHNVDPGRIYVTGLSAGGAMTAIMLATYPEIFGGGAIIAGLPYKCANDATEAQNTCMKPGKNLTPSQWGNLVRNATTFTGPWPEVSIWHGNADVTVAPINAAELMEQWTNVHGIDQSPDVENTVKRYPHKVFEDESGNALVETYSITGMGHGTPVDPGSGEDRCGLASAFIFDADICSSFYIGKFWGLDKP